MTSSLVPKLTKWGNSIGLRITRDMAAAMDLSAGSVVDITVEGRTIVIRKIKAITPRERSTGSSRL